MSTDRANSPVREPEGHYRHLVESAVDYAIVSCDIEGRVTAWNEGARRVLGWTEEEMLGQPLHRFFTPEDVEAGVVEREIMMARSAGRATDERWHLRKGGERFWASGEMMPIDRDGAVSGFVKILRDRTEQRLSAARLHEMNEHLQASQARLNAALEELRFLAQASAELAALTDYQTTMDKIAHLAIPRFGDWCSVEILSEGRALERVSLAHVDAATEESAKAAGLPLVSKPRSLEGGPWTVMRTGRPQRVDEIFPDMLERSTSEHRDLELVRLLGLHSYLGVPLTTHGKTFGVVSFGSASLRRYTDEELALAEDLARRAAVAIENAKLLGALQESDKAKDVFLATLAHELRNPLAPVWNGLALIKVQTDDPTRVHQMAGMIERQVAQLARLVDDLLDVSRITTGKIELKKQRTDLLNVVRGAVETSRPHIEAARHRLSMRLPDEPAELVADPVRLGQVFSNLLNNAAKYTPHGGQIEIEVEIEPQRAVVRVRDNGAGIAPEMLDKVFTLFMQVTHPVQRSQGGLGIGLSLVQALVRMHGGSVEARSAGLGQGSEFIVELPREAAGQAFAAAPAPAAAQAAQTPRQGKRVLVVDDNQDAAITLAELIRMMDSEAEVAHDGASAVAAVSRFQPDIVLLDIGLPDINGYEVARRIRALPGLAQPRLIALTGWGQEQDKRMAEQAGFDEHWTKPVDPMRLQELAA
jgi:PAS domain S-box-containing protein